MGALRNVRMHLTNSLSVATTLAIALACGGGDDPGITPPPPPPPPEFSVTLTATTASVTAAGTVSLTATPEHATDVAKVELYERVVGIDASPVLIATDTLAPFEWQRSMVSAAADNGSHVFTAKAYERSGGSVTSSPVTVAVNMNLAASTLVLESSHQRVIAPGVITLALPGTRALSRVEVFEGATKVGESVGHLDPRRIELTMSGAGDGTHTYTAKGYDATGAFATSNPVTVVVQIQWDVLGKVQKGHYMAGDGAGGFYVVAIDHKNPNTAAQDFDVFLAKHAANGAELWTRTYGSTDWETPNSVAVDAQGRAVVSGHISYPNQSRPGDCFVTVYGSAGNLVWTQRWDGIIYCRAAADASGNIYVAGSVLHYYNGSEFHWDPRLAKYDANGAQLWAREIELPAAAGLASAGSIAVDPTGSFFIGGHAPGSVDGTPSRGGDDAFVLKFDANGNQIWARQFGTADYDGSTTLASDGAGGVYAGLVSDQLYTSYGSLTDAVLARIGADGALQWMRKIDGGGYAGDHLAAVLASPDGVYLVGSLSKREGETSALRQTIQGSSDAFLASYGGDGTLRYVHLLGGPTVELGRGVGVAPDGSVLMLSSTNGGLGDIPINPSVVYWVLARHRGVAP